MARTTAAAFIASVFALSAFGFGQQGRDQGLYEQGLVRDIDGAISVYLNGDEIRSILTPGEFTEWKIKLKAGQVLFAEAASDAFDPALELLDGQNKILVQNDDRYPGDQRPLLMFRCTQDGEYALHVRCFHDKSGGQFTVRFKAYDSIDPGSGGMVSRWLEAGQPFLIRMHLKAGQIEMPVHDVGGDQGYMPTRYNVTISPTGLPVWNLFAYRIQPAIYAVMAPVDGDYYIMETPATNSSGQIHIGIKDIIPQKAAPEKPFEEGSVFTGKAPTNGPALWELPVKAGQLLEASVPDLDLNSRFVVAVAPDISKYDMSKPETNPFYPKASGAPSEEPAIDMLPVRSRDGRIVVFRARRDTKVWLASNGLGAKDKEFTLQVKDAASSLKEEATSTGKLRIGSTDYWAFDGKAGDVMTFKTGTAGFNEEVVVRNPDLAEVRHVQFAPDQASDTWRMIVQKPGRYLVAVSSLGDGGGGEYSLSRTVLHPKDFNASSPAKAEISDGQVQIWKFVAKPDDPLLVHWRSSAWSYEVALYNDKGEPVDFERQDIDAHNKLGILKVTKPSTYVIVLTGRKEKATYSIELNAVPMSMKS